MSLKKNALAHFSIFVTQLCAVFEKHYITPKEIQITLCVKLYLLSPVDSYLADMWQNVNTIALYRHFTLTFTKRYCRIP